MEEEEAPVAFDTFAPLAVGRFVKGADVLDSGALCFDFEMHEGQGGAKMLTYLDYVI